MYVMDDQLGSRGAAVAIARGLECIGDPGVVERLEAALGAAGDASTVDWPAIAEDANALATALENLLPSATNWAEASHLLDTATMIRVRAGGAARRGGPFEWRQRGAMWSAAGGTGTHWDVIHQGPGHALRGFGIIVARWDRPDWICAELEDAKRIAEEIDARPKFAEHQQIEERLHDN